MSVRFHARTSRSTGVSVGPFSALLLGLIVLGLLAQAALLLAVIFAATMLVLFVADVVRGYRKIDRVRKVPDAHD